MISGKKEAKMFTPAGIINTQVSAGRVKIKLTDPKAIKLDIPIKVNGRLIKVNFINTGVPHVEEQFYIVFPLLLVVINRYFGGR